MATYLDQACAGEAGLRAEIETLLEADEKAGRFLETPAGEYAAPLLDELSGAAEADAVEGRELGPYRVIREIGSGGMGVVYEARDTRLHRSVALKLLPAAWSRDAAAKTRFLREARAASALDHTNICTVHDIGEAPDGRLFIVMSYYPGETLDRKLERGPLPIPEALALALQLARGLEKAHDAGITHRDVKPANVMVSERGEVKILDFGIAKVAGDAGLTRTGTSPGTPAYMSPEQARGHEIDARTDIWSLGAVLYEMITGRRPFRASHPQAMIYAILHQDPEPLDRDDVPENLALAIDKMLAKDPAERYATVSELIADLESQAPPKVGTPRHGASKPLAGAEPRAVWKGRWRAAPATLVIAAAVIVAVLVVRSWQTPAPPLYVAVTEPELTEDAAGNDQALLAAAVRAGILQGLATLRGVAALSTESLETVPGTPVAVARALAADEILSSRLDCPSQLCRVTLSRIDGNDGRTVWTESFEAPADDVAILVTGALSHLRAGFPSFRPRAGAWDAEVPADAYEAYLRLLGSFESRDPAVSGDELLDRLERLRSAAPQFLEPYLLEAQVARESFFHSREPALLERALRVLRQAREIAPRDPRALGGLFDVADESERWDVAKQALDELEKIEPSHSAFLVRKAEYLDHLGRDDEALVLMRRAAELRPAGPYLFNLALMEYQHGHVEATRQTLEKLLGRLPEHFKALSFLAQVELLSGRPNRAADLYQELTRRSPGVLELSNLGLAQLLLERYDEAARSYRRAYEKEPDNPVMALNLADAVGLVGRHDDAAELYRKTLELLDRDPAAAGWQQLSVRAQALAHLGSSQQAAAAVQRALQLSPGNPQVVFEAALVYAVIGDRSSALANVENALDLGFGVRWFDLPWFDALRSDDTFLALLGRAATPQEP